MPSSPTSDTTPSNPQSEPQVDLEGESRPSRLYLLDALRGLLVVGMVLFHLCYDLVYIAGFNLPWFSGMPMVLWRWALSWSFLFLAGMMCSCSKNNFRRAAKYLFVALLIYLVTLLARVDTPISFGIIFCMGACTLFEYFLEKVSLSPRGIACVIAMLCLFAFSMGVPYGFVGLGMSDVLRVALPYQLYSCNAMSWLGFPGPTFASGDYYPIIPHMFMFLAGAALGHRHEQTGWPAPIRTLRCLPLEFIGRHALEIYIAHQPVLLLLVMQLG